MWLYINFTLLNNWINYS